MDTSNLLHMLNQKVRLHSKNLNEQLQQFGLYSAQWTILYVLSQKGPMSQTDIWQYLKVEAPTVTRTLTRMESSGWINRRQGKDKRERIIELSSHAKQFFPTIKGKIETLDQEYLAPLSEQERLQLLHLLEKLGTKKDDLDES